MEDQINKEKFNKDLSQGLRFEQELIIILEKKEGMKIKKLSDYADIDLCYYSDKGGMGFIEAKYRKYPKNEFPDTKIPLRKYIKALDNYKDGFKTLLFIKWEDGGIGYINMVSILPIKIQEEVSRWDRGKNEKNQYVYYNISDFTMLKDLNDGIITE